MPGLHQFSGGACKYSAIRARPWCPESVERLSLRSGECPVLYDCERSEEAIFMMSVSQPGSNRDARGGREASRTRNIVWGWQEVMAAAGRQRPRGWRPSVAKRSPSSGSQRERELTPASRLSESSWLDQRCLTAVLLPCSCKIHPADRCSYEKQGAPPPWEITVKLDAAGTGDWLARGRCPGGRTRCSSQVVQPERKGA